MRFRYWFILAIVLLLFLGGVFVKYYNFDNELFTRLSFYVDLANPSMKAVKITPGLRKEQVAERVGERLDWNEKEKEDFINMHLALNTTDLEGKFFPKTYLVNKESTPAEVGKVMTDEFAKQINKIKKEKIKQKSKIANEDTILKIASIIEREAGGKQDMALISGIIWNRIFSGMKLQIDATLQYAKGNAEDGWWTKVYSKDKEIDSEYNTYLNKGLPPSPIASPSKDAIYAAYNPEKTDCLFYLHDKNKQIYCAKTYEEHKENIEKYLKTNLDKDTSKDKENKE